VIFTNFLASKVDPLQTLWSRPNAKECKYFLILKFRDLIRFRSDSRLIGVTQFSVTVTVRRGRKAVIALYHNAINARNKRKLWRTSMFVFPAPYFEWKLSPVAKVDVNDYWLETYLT